VSFAAINLCVASQRVFIIIVVVVVVVVYLVIDPVKIRLDIPSYKKHLPIKTVILQIVPLPERLWGPPSLLSNG
jgi:hypothetical protein